VNVRENSYLIPLELRPLFRSRNFIDIQIVAGSTIALAALADPFTPDTPVDTSKDFANFHWLLQRYLKPVCLVFQLQVRCVKRPSHGKLKLANSCWQTQVGVCERRKNSRQTCSICRLQFANVFVDWFCAVHTHQLELANSSLPTRVCQL